MRTRTPHVAPARLSALALALLVAACPSSPTNDDADSGPAGDPYALPDLPVAEVPRFLRDRINAMREQAGLDPMLNFAELEAAAQAHAKYVGDGIAAHKFHTQVPNTPGFTGEDYRARAEAAEYPHVAMGELIAFRRDTKLAPLWLDGPYARALILQQHAKYIGIGSASGEMGSAAVLMAGFRASDGLPTAGDVIWPADGTKGVPRSWDPKWTTPMPKEPATGWPSGPVISVVFAPDQPYSITSSELKPEGGQPLDHVLLDTKSAVAHWLGSSIALYANDPLAGETTYVVTLGGTYLGQPWSRSSQFTTRP